jgi:hypothetical protein
MKMSIGTRRSLPEGGLSPPEGHGSSRRPLLDETLNCIAKLANVPDAARDEFHSYICHVVELAWHNCAERAADRRDVASPLLRLAQAHDGNTLPT